jgi:hypothetical protein
MTVGECRDAPNPRGYREWHEWAEKQEKRGAKQVKCALCNLWCYRSERCRHFRAAEND